jgi:hypothetical protein
MRLIMDLSILNTYLSIPQFKMVTTALPGPLSCRGIVKIEMNPDTLSV